MPFRRKRTRYLDSDYPVIKRKGDSEMRKRATAGSKKAVEPEMVNGELLSNMKRTNFDLAAEGV